MNKTIAICALVALFAITAHASPVELTAGTFDEKTADGKVYFIKFFAPWCGHCKKLAPTWDELANKVNKDDGDMVVAKVDCTKEKDVCTQAKISGYPTLKIFYGGEEKARYSGSRTLEALEDFMSEQQKLLMTETVA